MQMCEQQGLHQVDLLSPAKNRISDKEYRAKQRGQKKLDELNKQIVAAKMKPAVTVFQTQKQFLRDAILEIISKAATVDEFKTLLKEKNGIAVKERRGRFSYLHPERSKFITGRALGGDFEKEHIEQMILKNYQTKDQDRQNPQEHDQEAIPAVNGSASDRNPATDRKKYNPAYDYHADPVAILYVRSHLRLVVDLQTNIKAQQSAAYARKVKISNLKEMARTVVYVQEHGYDTREDLLHYQTEISGKVDTVSSSLSEAEAKLKETNERIHYTGQYYASRSVQSEFLKFRNKKKYREAHRTKLDQYNEAVRYFKENAGGKVPAMKSLKAEKEQLQHFIEKQKKLQASLRTEQKELQTAVANIDAILGEVPVQRREKRKAEPEL